MDKSALSEDGKRLYDETGFHELIVPFVYDEHDSGPSPFYMTVDFVLDEELTEKYENFDDDAKHKFLTTNRLRELVNKGFVCEVYDAGPIEDVDDLAEQIDDIHLLTE